MSELRRSELSEYEKGQINALSTIGCKVAQISRQINRPHSTITGYLKREKERGTYKNSTRPGRPQVLDGRSKRRLLRTVTSGRRQSLTEIQQNVVPQASRRTIQRVLAKANIKKWRAKERPTLKKEHVAARLEWALKYKDWTEEDWKAAIWSDECNVERGSDPRLVWVFRTPKEKWYKECISPKFKGQTIGTMVWGCFHGSVRGPLVPIIVKSITGEVYLSLLKIILPTVLQRVQQQLPPGKTPIFMQDNAPVHTARIVKKWCEENNIPVMKWPPYSPDLNPIENCWKHLKEKLQIEYPELATYPGGKPRVQAKLREVLPEVWDKIEGDYLQSLCSSMCTRVNAVIEAKGWYTKY